MAQISRQRSTRTLCESTPIRTSVPRKVESASQRKRGLFRSENEVSNPFLSRRDFVLFSGALTGVVHFWNAPTSFALLPDDDDADLVNKAKARRKKKIQEEIEFEKKFIREEGLRKTDEQKFEVSIQNAVYNLAKSGSKLEAGTLKDVSTLLGERWVKDFDSAATEVSAGINGALNGKQEILSGIASLKSAAEKGDLVASKKQFVDVVTSFQNWTSLVGLRSSLEGL